MKSWIYLSIVCCFVFLSNLNAIGQEKELHAIIKAIESQDTRSIYNYCENAISLNIPGSNGKYSKTQAQKILNNFFESQSLKQLKTIKLNTEVSENSYAILEYISVVKSYNFYFQLGKQGNKFLIRKIQIQEIRL